MYIVSRLPKLHGCGLVKFCTGEEILGRKTALSRQMKNYSAHFISIV